MPVVLVKAERVHEARPDAVEQPCAGVPVVLIEAGVVHARRPCPVVRLAVRGLQRVEDA